MTLKYDNIHWLSDGDYKKLRFRMKAEMGELWNRLGLNDYGQHIYKQGFIDTTWRLIEDAMLVSRGVDKIIDIDRIVK